MRPSLTALLREHREAFDLGDLKVRVAYTNLEGLKAAAMCFPHYAAGRRVSTVREVTVFIDEDLPEGRVLPALLHELIHAEQFHLEGYADHGAYFEWRCNELLAAGLPVLDGGGQLWVP